MRTWLAAAIALAAGTLPVEALPVPALHARAEGSRLSVGWTAAPAAATEWEAFLSFDGGKSISLRVTPHLPISTREFRFDLPRLAATEATVVFRFGDGRVEREYLAPAVIGIESVPSAQLLTARAADTGAVPAPGEETSVGWVESDEVTVIPPLGSGFAPTSRLTLPPARLSFTRSSPATVTDDRTGRSAPLDASARLEPGRPARVPDILLLTTRLNV